MAGRLAAIAETKPVMVSSRTGEGIRELRAEIDRIAAAVVAQTRANLPTLGTSADGGDGQHQPIAG
jgi:50S ribosomal subunit-associated GTPase HflX